MSDTIPRVSFRQPKKDPFAFEIMTLRSLFARNHRLDPMLDRPHRVQFYQILYICRGEGQHQIDFKPYGYSDGTLLFISQGQVQAFDVNPDTDGFLLLFGEAFLTRSMTHSDASSYSRLYNYHLYRPDIRPGNEGKAVFGPIVREIYDEYLSFEAVAREDVLATLFKLLLLKAARRQQPLVSGAQNRAWIQRFGRFQDLLSRHFAQNRNAGDYAKMMDLSYNHLNQVVKAVTGRTAKAFIDQFIIMECRRQLAVSDLSVKELAYLMGFDEPTNFVKYFKKHTRLSPAQFRKTLTR